MKLIIADTSCLIIFSKIDRLDILQNTFTELVTTDKVMEEYGKNLSWLTVRNDYNLTTYEKFAKNFGSGESSCMALATTEPNPILIIDDRRAKKVAEDIGIQCIGSLGVLLLAKREGVLSEIKSVIEKIKQTNFRISDKVVAAVLKLAKETE